MQAEVIINKWEKECGPIKLKKMASGKRKGVEMFLSEIKLEKLNLNMLIQYKKRYIWRKY